MVKQSKKEPSKVEQPYLQAKFNQGPLEIGVKHQTKKNKKKWWFKLGSLDILKYAWFWKFLRQKIVLMLYKFLIGLHDYFLGIVWKTCETIWIESTSYEIFKNINKALKLFFFKFFLMIFFSKWHNICTKLFMPLHNNVTCYDINIYTITVKNMYV